MQEILDYLKKNEYENVYIIRGLRHEIKNFRYEITRDKNNDINGIAAIWEAEKGATLRGNTELCSRWFDQLYGQYNLYELEESFVEEKLRTFNGKVPKGSITYNLIMVYTPEKRLVKEGDIGYKSIDKMEWYEMAKTFKKRYNKEFIEFEPDNMEWLCVYKEEEIIATICIEKADQELAMISSFYVVPDFRQQGIGTRLLAAILQDYGDWRFMLFVDPDNTKARKLYEKMGFEVHKMVLNIEV